MRPTEILEQEHRTIEALADRLERSAVAALRTESMDLATIRMLVHVLLVHDRSHRRKEEAMFLSLIEELGMRNELLRAALLTEEHTSGQDLLRRMEKDLHESTGMGPRARVALCYGLITFADGVRQHIRMEEEFVFPQAEALFGESVRERLRLSFDRIEELDPFPGTGEEIQELVGDPSAAGRGPQFAEDAS